MKKSHQTLPVLASFLLLLLLLLAEPAVLLAQPPVARSPALESLSSPEADRSGRIVLLGSGFGGQGNDGRVLVDGLPAIVTSWLPNEIHAYVPEAASLGMVDVQVVNGRGASAALPLEVTLREPVGRIVWQFQTERWMTRQFVEVGPDGRVYTSDHVGLYALSADGALVWFVPDTGGGFPIDIGPDGTIYTASSSEGPEIIHHPTLHPTDDTQTDYPAISALNPDGSLKWKFVPPVTWPLVAGPNVGPDGNIYAAQKFPSEGGLGFFSLDPQGELLWSNPGDPPLDGVYGGSEQSSEIVFASDRFYAGAVFLRGGPHASTYAFSLGGDQIWFTGELDVLFHGFPRVDPQERAVGVWGQTGIITLLPDGDVDWIQRHPGDPNFLLMPAIDPAGNIYTGDLIGVDLWSLTPDGETRWVAPSDEFMRNVGVAPDASVVVASGSDGPEADSWVIGHDAATGARLWKQILPREEGLRQHSSNLYPMFSADSRTAYLTTHFNNVDVVEHGYLLAIATPRSGIHHLPS